MKAPQADIAAGLFWSAAARSPKSALRAAVHLLDAPSPLAAPLAARTLRDGVAGRLAQVIARRLGPRAWDAALYRPATLAPTAGRRVLLISHELTASGAPKIVVEMAEAYVALGCEVWVVAPDDGPFRATLVALGANVIVDRDVLGGGGVAATLGRGFDLAICNTVVCDLLVARIARFCPCVWYIHEVSLLESKLAQPTFRRGLAAASAVWAGSELPASLIRPLREDVQITPYGLEPAPQGGPAGARQGPARIGLFGSIEPRKGQDLALAALARLPATLAADVEVTLFGRILLEDYGREVLDAAAALPCVTFGGALDYEAYLAQVAAMDAVLIPSRDDTLPLVSLDALSSGRVLLTSRRVGTSSYLVDGVNGFVAADASAEALADMLERALASRAAWNEIGQAGRAVFAAGFSKSAFRVRLESLLDQVAPVAAGHARVYA